MTEQNPPIESPSGPPAREVPPAPYTPLQKSIFGCWGFSILCLLSAAYLGCRLWIARNEFQEHARIYLFACGVAGAAAAIGLITAWCGLTIQRGNKPAGLMVALIMCWIILAIGLLGVIGGIIRLVIPGQGGDAMIELVIYSIILAGSRGWLIAIRSARRQLRRPG